MTLTTLTGGGNSYLYENGGPYTLTNVNNTIQGEGNIGQGTAMTLLNQPGGTINANSTGGPLVNTLQIQLAGSGGNPGIVNQSLMEATNSGTLELTATTINNAGGNITANGAGATVQLDSGTVIQGGTLNALNGGNGADGSTALALRSPRTEAPSPALVTINGTLHGHSKQPDLIVKGTFDNNGNIQINGGAGTNAYLWMNGDTTLQGSGGGTVTLSSPPGGGSAFIYSQAGLVTLNNVNNTIQGSGTIGDGIALNITNGSQGTILANASGLTLLIDGNGTLTNSGTLQANAGSSLHVATPTTLTNFSGGVLTGGTYKVYGTSTNPGTIQIDSLGNQAGGGEITSNAATILLHWMA